MGVPKGTPVFLLLKFERYTLVPSFLITSLIFMYKPFYSRQAIIKKVLGLYELLENVGMKYWKILENPSIWRNKTVLRTRKILENSGFSKIFEVF